MMKPPRTVFVSVFAAMAALAGCSKKADDAAGAPPATQAVADVPPPAPDSPLAQAIVAANACDPEASCEALDALYDATADLTAEQYRGAIELATSEDARRALIEAVQPRLDEPILGALIVAADACDPEADRCVALDELGWATSGLTPALFRAGMQRAKTDDVRRELLSGIRGRMEASLVADVAAYATHERLGRVAQAALGAREDTAALERLVTLLDNHDRTDTVHSEVPALLARYPGNAAVKAAVPKLRAMAKTDKQGWGRANAAKAVATIEGAAAIPFLLELIGTETWSVARAVAVTELGKLKAEPAALASLKKLAKDADADVSKAAAKALL